MIVQWLISSILFIIPEVIMSWILEAATLLPLLHSALTLNRVSVIITFMLSCLGRHIFWGNLMGSGNKKEKSENQRCDWHNKDGKCHTVSAQNTSVTKRVFVLMVLSQLLTVEGASVMQIRIVFVTRWTFHSASFNAACHGTLVVDSFPTLWNVPRNLWKPVSWLSVTARSANRNVSQLLLSHAAEINNLSPQINNNKRWRGEPRMNLRRIKAPFLILNQRQGNSLKLISV